MGSETDCWGYSPGFESGLDAIDPGCAAVSLCPTVQSQGSGKNGVLLYNLRVLEKMVPYCTLYNLSASGKTGVLLYNLSASGKNGVLLYNLSASGKNGVLLYNLRASGKNGVLLYNLEKMVSYCLISGLRKK